MTFSDIAPYLLVAFIVFLNIALWTSFRNRGANKQLDLWRKTLNSMQNPWEKEDKNLHELSDRVQNLRKNSPDDHDKNDNE